MKKLAVFVFLVMMHRYVAYSQCMMYPLSLTDRVNESTTILEGKVISQYGFWDTTNSFIFTANTIEVYKVFKGNHNSTIAVIITEGGTAGNLKHIAEPSLTVNVNETGIFFLQTSVITSFTGWTPSAPGYMTYGSAQGFIRYEASAGRDVFNYYSDVPSEIYSIITTTTGNAWQTLAPFNIYNTGPGINSLMPVPPVISGINPNSIVAGTLGANVLTITGNNFGPSYGGSTNLQFPDANNGGAGFISTPANHILTWTATSITCWVPTGAGSGFIRITNNLGEATTAGINLTINYNESNVVSAGTYYQPDLVNDNGTGGFTYTYNTTFNGNAPAVQAFERALQTWRCGTFVNFWRTGTTAIGCQANDGTNLVSFDGGCALPAGVLGVSYSYYQACGGPLNWYLSENDLKFRTNGTSGINWNYGPAATAGGFFDFESVSLHELGHSHQLGHTITPVTVMNFAIGPNTDRRTLNAVSETAGGNDVMSRSVVNNTCGPTAMLALNGANCSILAPVAAFTASPLSGCNNLSVTFTDQSAGSPTSWSWSFPGGVPNAFAGQFPPPVSYPIGTYTVTLTVTNGSGSDAEIKTNYITVNNCPPPVADFSGVPVTLCEGQSVSFTDLSTQNPTSWSWTFGGGGTPNTSFAQNPVSAFNTAGVYNVSLTSTNSIGSGSVTKNSYITVNSCPPPPVPAFTGTPLTLCSGQTVTFTNQTTGVVSNYQWSFPGGTPPSSFLVNPVITYNVPGIYSVTLVATNNAGSNSFTQSNYITVNACTAPVVNFSGAPQVICSGSTVQYSDLSTQSPSSWSWTFPGGTPAASALQNPVITYNVPGVYNATLSATNSFGTGTPVTKPNYITVSNCPPAGSGLIVNDGGFIYAQPGALIQVGINASAGGVINQDNGGNIGIIDNRGQVVVTGDWTNNSAGNCFTSPVTLTGEVQLTNGAQLLQGSTATDFYNLTLTGTGIKRMSVDQNVYGTLALNTIELATQQHTMWVINSSAAAITRTPAFNSTAMQGFVSSTGIGRLRRNMNSTSGYEFPVGSATGQPRYRPILLTPNSNGAQSFTVRMVNNDPTLDLYDRTLRDPSLGNINPYYYWKINRLTGSGGVNIREYFDQVADNVGPVAQTLMTQWRLNGSLLLWRDQGVVTGVALGPSLSYIEKNAWSDFNTENFSFAGLSSPLPVEMLSFDGACSGNRIKLKWITATESDCAVFEILFSNDGASFVKTGSVTCKGETSSGAEYSFDDNRKNGGKYFYRIRQVDFNGNSDLSKTIVVNCTGSLHVMVYPNPAYGLLHVNLDDQIAGSVQIRIFNATGALVIRENFYTEITSHAMAIPVDHLAPGIYQVVIENSGISVTEKILLNR